MIQHGELRELVRLNHERFKYDARYSLSALSRGFTSRNQVDEDDSALLDRICTAYIKATERQGCASNTFGPTKWWQQISARHLTPVVQALRTRDLDVLGRMYGNFFRDACSTGLVGLPVDMQRCYFSTEIDPVFAHFFLGDALHRLDVWREATQGRLPLKALGCPSIGNPYGVVVDGVFIRIGAEYQHFYANEITQLLPPNTSGTVLEIGGGFGGMAYYLLRDNPGVRYVNLDVPETLALASYYLLKSFPVLNASLYGEAEELNNSQIILMPSCELTALPDLSADVSFSSYVLTDLAPESLSEYTHQLTRASRSHVMLVDRSDAVIPLSSRFTLVRERRIYWDAARALTTDQTEWLYSLSEATA